MQNSPRIVFCGILAGEMINGRAGSSPSFMITIGDNLSTNLPSPEKLGGSELLQGRVEMCDVVTGGGGGGVSCVEGFTGELSILYPSKVSSGTQP